MVKYAGPERRKAERLQFVTPLGYKICKKSTISKLLNGYTSDVSSSGLLCNIKDRVKKNDILWLSFDRSTLLVCEELEKHVLIYQNGVLGKVVRIEPASGEYKVGVQFVTREEKNLTNIHPKIYFLEQELAQENEKK